MVRRGSCLATWVLWGGCVTGFESEQAQLHLDPTDTVFLAPFAELVPNGTPLLAGAELCVALACSDADATCPRSIDIGACFDQTVDGGSLPSEDCATADTAGTFVWHFDPVADVAACGADPATYVPVPDAVTFEVVEASDVTPVLFQWAEDAAGEVLISADGSGFPSDWTVADDEVFQVVDGGTLRLPIVFTHNDDGQHVAWDTTQVDVVVVTTSGTEPTVTVPSPGWLTFTAASGGTSEIQVTDGAETWVAGTVVGVDSDVSSLEIVVAYSDFDDDEHTPYAARAVLRDATGALVYGAPVVWTVTDGDLVVDPEGVGDEGDGELPGPDYAMLGDVCTAPPADAPETRTATLEATFGGVTDSVTFTWMAPVGDPSSFTPDTACGAPQDGGEATGCACDQGGASPWGAAALLAWVVRRRRKSV
jgi:uncharacterized protein (TIGR03382 family)